MLSLLNLAARKVKDDFLEVIKIPAHSDIEMYFKAFLKIQNEGKLNQITLNESIKNQQEKLLSVMDQVVKALSISIDSQEDENSDDDTGRDGNTSDEDLSGKEGKAKEGKVSEPSSSSSSIALPEKIITLASIREVYSKFKAKGDDFDSDDEEAWNLQDKYEEYFKILKNQVKNEKLGKGKIEEILEEFYKDCASNELAETDFCFLYNTHNANLVKMSLLNLAARIDKDNFVKMLPRTADIEMHFKYFLEKQKEGQFNQIEFNESIKNQQEKVQSVINEVAKALKISIDVTPESQSSSTSSSVGSLSASTISEVTISSVLPEIAVITDSGGSSELSGDSTETGEHLPG